MYNPNNNTVGVHVDKELESRINNATSTGEIYLALVDAYKNAGYTQADGFRDDLLYPSEKALANEPPKLTRAFKVDGRQIILEGASADELNQKEVEFHRQLQAEPKEQPLDQSGRPIGAEQQAANAELELKFKRGEISTDEFLLQSGAIERHLEAQGIDMNSLREVSGRGFEQSWKTAAAAYLNSQEGANWPGGEANMKIVGEILEANGLQDTVDKQAAIAAAVRFAREHDMLVSNPETEAANAIASATDFESIRELGHRALGLPSSGLFGR